MRLKAPFTIQNNTLATSSPDTYVEEMIEQVLFVRQGERVNRPQFGCGLEDAVFEALTGAVAGVTEHLIQTELQAYVAEIAEIVSVRASAHNAELDVRITYISKLTGARNERRFSSPTR